MYCKNCLKEIPDDASFCAYCGARLGALYEGEQTVYEGEKTIRDGAPGPSGGSALKGDKRISEHMTLGSDGAYRWVYKMNLFKDPTVFLTVYKIFFFIVLGLFLFVFLLDAFDSGFDPELIVGELRMFGLIWVVVTALVVISYLIYCLIMRGRYVVEFEMDENGITHRQIPSQAKKAKVIGNAAAVTGILAGKPAGIGAGIAASRTEMYSSYASVKKVKAYPRRDLIKVNGTLDHNQIYAYKEDFGFVKEYIVSRCCNLKNKKT